MADALRSERLKRCSIGWAMAMMLMAMTIPRAEARTRLSAINSRSLWLLLNSTIVAVRAVI